MNTIDMLFGGLVALVICLVLTVAVLRLTEWVSQRQGALPLAARFSGAR